MAPSLRSYFLIETRSKIKVILSSKAKVMKIRIVSKKEFELVKMQAEKKEQ